MMKGYRTIILAVLVAVVGALQGLDWVKLIPDHPQTVGYIVSALGIAFGTLRYVTNTPIGKAAP